MKKVIFLLPWMTSRGVEKSLLGLLQYLPRDEYSITVMFGKKEGGFMRLLPSDIEIQELPLPESVKYDICHWSSSRDKMIREIRQGNLFGMIGILYRKCIKKDPLGGYTLPFSKMESIKEKFDIAVCYHMHSTFFIRYVVEKILADKKIIWIHNDFYTTGLDPKIYRKELLRYDYVFGVSQQVINEFIEQIPEMEDRTFLFHNIVPAEQIRIQAGKHIPSEYMESRSRDIPIILSVGSLEKQKGFDIAIKAAKILMDQKIAFKWYILGEGPERDDLQKKIDLDNLHKHIQLCGVKMNPYPYYKFCDIYVQPSRHEGYGIAVEEARIFYRPIITTDFAGAKEQIIDNVTGFIVDLDSIALSEKIKKLLITPSLRKDFEKNLSIEAEKQIGFPQLGLLKRLIG